MSYKALRVIISGGGTGGHIFPAISIADALKKANPDTEILFVGANGKMEMEKVPSAGYRIVGLPVAGLQRKLTLRGIWRNLQLPFKLLASNARAGKVLKEFRPDIAVGVDANGKKATLAVVNAQGQAVKSGSCTLTVKTA